MRWTVLLVLAAFLFGICAPQSAEISVIRDGHLMIGSLDVCHSTTPVLSTSSDMPYLNTGACVRIPVSLIAYMNIPDSVFPHFFIPQQNDRPPKA
jgi:hypothetical protein